MGRLIAQIPNEDRARLSRILDAKYRVIGVRSTGQQNSSPGVGAQKSQHPLKLRRRNKMVLLRVPSHLPHNTRRWGLDIEEV